MRSTPITIAVLLTVLAVGACSTTPATPASPSPASPSSAGTGRSGDRGAGGRLEPVSKVLVVVEENHSYEEMRGEMPYLARLSDQYGYATHWRAITHPSEPNYLAIAGGSTFGIADDDPPSSHHGQIGSARSVFDQALAAGRTAGVYAEGMPEPCHPVDYPSQAPLYAVRHNPWVYFEAGRAGCRAHDLALSAFAGDVAADRLPDVCFLIPDLEHDGHSASLAAADTWLKGRLEPVLRSDDFASGRLLVVVTADEDDGHSGNIVLTSVLDRRLSGVVVDTPLNHYSLTRYIDEVLGVSPLRDATDAPDMKAAFHL